MADQISDSTKLEVTRTSRGFAVAMGVDLYAEPYSIQDSSLAEEAAIWLGRDADTGGRAHLTQDMAAGLIPLLQAFVATGSIAGPADTIAAPPAMDREAVERKFWLIIREPGRVPDRKGPWPLEQTASILREFIAANPNSFIDYLTIGPDGSPYVDHGPEVLQMTDGRSMSVGRKHNARVREAATAALSTLSADAIRQGEGIENGYTADDAVDFVFNRLASKLGLADWQVVEGSEEWEGDVSATLHRLLVDAGIIDDETGAVATLATPASHASDGGK